MENWKEALINEIKDKLASTEPDKWIWPGGYSGCVPLFYVGTVLDAVREVLYNNENDEKEE